MDTSWSVEMFLTESVGGLSHDIGPRTGRVMDSIRGKIQGSQIDGGEHRGYWEFAPRVPTDR